MVTGLINSDCLYTIIKDCRHEPECISLMTQAQQYGSNFTIEQALSDLERPYYYNLFMTVSQDGQFTDGRLVDFLKKSKLPNAQLKDLWFKFAHNSDRVTKLQFLTMMRALALYQNNIMDVDQYLLARNFPYLPNIDGIPKPNLPSVLPNPTHMNVAFAPLTDADLKIYEEVIDNVDTI